MENDRLGRKFGADTVADLKHLAPATAALAAYGVLINGEEFTKY